MCSEVLKCTFALSSPPEKKAPNATRMNLAQFCLVIPSVCVMLLTPVSGVLFCAPVQVSHVQRSVIYRLAEQKKKKVTAEELPKSNHERLYSKKCKGSYT